MRSALLVAFNLLVVASSAHAATDCFFAIADRTMHLAADCTTDSSITIPDGMTLDGGNHTITAVDPPGGHFTGGILINGGATASVIDTRLTTESLADVCDAGDGRLRGIFLNAASGVVSGNTVLHINQGPSSCQEGNGIEVSSFSGGLVSVEIVNNVVDAYQKSGIVASGNVDASIHHNRIGSSATQANLPANAMQVGFGAWAAIEHNAVAGNRWLDADAAATAVLLSGTAPGSIVRENTIDGNADVGIYVTASNVTVSDNRVFEDGPDGFYDVGIVSVGQGNDVRNNDVRGYGQKYFGLVAGIALQVRNVN